MDDTPAIALTAEEVRCRILQRNTKEISIIDVRELGDFARGHLLWATSIPFSNLETKTADLLPRFSVPIILCSGSEVDKNLLFRAALKLREFGYSNRFYLEGGIEAWINQGYEIFSGVNVPSKAFGEYVEKKCDTPHIKPELLKKMIDNKDNVIILDSRPADEYQMMRVPGGINCPGAELTLRINDLVSDPKTVVVVNCAGRTRSIIGCQSLINAQISNPVYALENGTMGWHLAGYTLEYGGRSKIKKFTAKGHAKARKAVKDIIEKFEIKTINWNTLQRWKKDNQRSTFLFDVRQPDEYKEGHVNGAVSAPGGQLIQATDQFIGTLGAKVVLSDYCGVRAVVTAAWLRQMGWIDIFVLDMNSCPDFPIKGEYVPRVLKINDCSYDFVDAAQLNKLMESNSVNLIDVSDSVSYVAGHIPGAYFATRANLFDDVKVLPKGHINILTSFSGQQALFASCDLTREGIKTKVLRGGTNAWKRSGFQMETGMSRNLCDPNDFWDAPYADGIGKERAMKKYISWEIELIQQIERDGTTNFNVHPSS